MKKGDSRNHDNAAPSYLMGLADRISGFVYSSLCNPGSGGGLHVDSPAFVLVPYSMPVIRTICIYIPYIYIVIYTMIYAWPHYNITNKQGCIKQIIQFNELKNSGPYHVRMYITMCMCIYWYIHTHLKYPKNVRTLWMAITHIFLHDFGVYCHRYESNDLN